MITTTIEESIQKDPSKFQAVLETKVPDIMTAMRELSSKLDGIIGSAIQEYCAAEGAEADMSALNTYKSMNRLITGKLDILIGEYIKEKRKNL